jgi:3-methylcrotonyl-CoA carboxylase alpha subunit
VDDPDAFPEALAAARREAKAAFGDDRVLVEKYVEKPRHIEVQVFGDMHGNVVHLFERDCSAQRRHQKVIEEAPAPGMTTAMRAAMTEAAVKAAKAISYTGAGTIEFIVDGSDGLRPDRFWFMEMNTRLQVEHPVTEMVTGVDLVEWQLRVAAGEPLPLSQDRILLNGHAFEARLYAEDAARGFLPATGTLHRLRFPAERSGAVRVETGVREGDTISPYYDPMIAKLVTHGPDRQTALNGLREVLGATRIAGCTVNTAFLTALADDPSFVAGDVDTAMIERGRETLTRVPQPSSSAIAQAALSAAEPAAGDGVDPWSRLTGYAHFHTQGRLIRLRYGEEDIAASVSAQPDGRYRVEIEGVGSVLRPRQDEDAPALWPGHVTVFDGPFNHDFRRIDPFELAEDAAGGSDTLRAPMPGLVKLVRVQSGEAVRKGQHLLVLEAMKMEHAIAAPYDGMIDEIAREGAQVSDGAILVRFSSVQEAKPS